MDKTILFVDDEGDYLRLMGRKMGSWGYQVISVQDANQAMLKLGDCEVGAIVLDHRMPDINGIRLLEKIRIKEKSIPVIMLTAYPSQEAMEKIKKLQISAFIPKVSDYVNTTEVLHTALDLIFKQRSKKVKADN